MELFTLGADRGAYTETDVRELARALSGWRADWQRRRRLRELPLRPQPLRHAARRRCGPARRTRAAARSTGATRARSCSRTRSTARSSCSSCGRTSSRARRRPRRRPRSRRSTSTAAARSAQVVEAILMHPDLYLGAPLVKPPAVYNAGLLRATGQTITTRRLGLARRHGRPDALLSAERLGLERPRAGSTRRRCTAAGTSPTRCCASTSATAAHYTGSTETGAQARRRRDRPRRQPGAHAETLRRAADASPTSPRPTQRAQRSRLPRDAPERAAPRSSRPPPTSRCAEPWPTAATTSPARTSCAARSRRPAPACRSSSRGCRSRPGPGLTRRSMLLRSAGPRARRLRRRQDADARRPSRPRSPRPPASTRCSCRSSWTAARTR